MVYYGLLWFIMVYYGLLWFIMVYYGLFNFIQENVRTKQTSVVIEPKKQGDSINKQLDFCLNSLRIHETISGALQFRKLYHYLVW